MPFDLDLHPYLKRVLDRTYNHEIILKSLLHGAYDSNWLKEYELFYNKQTKSNPYVTRVLFKFKEKRGKSAGFSHIRPVTDGSELSETYLVPPKNLCAANDVYIKCLDEFDAYGERVECTPYIMPETIFGMCIHASIWICLKILEKRAMVERSLSIPEIQNLARGSPYADREGLLFKQAARILRMGRASSFYVINVESPRLTDMQMLMELYAYVESRLPVIIGVDIADLPWWRTDKHGYHSLVTIGHTMEENRTNGFVFHDESLLPYVTMKNDKLLKAWHIPTTQPPSRYVREMLVAVPPEVVLPFHSAYQQFEKILSVFQEKGVTSEKVENLVIRPFLKGGSELFIETRNLSLLRALKEAQFPSHVWAFFLYDQNADRKDEKSLRGFFVRDATARTDLRFFFFMDEKKAIYQVEEGKVYTLHEGAKKRKII